MRLILPITLVPARRYRGGSRVLTIGRMPARLKRFFTPVRDHFGAPAYGHFWRLVVALTVCHGATIERLAASLRDTTHRTKHGEFLWKSLWEESWVVQQVVLDTLKRLYRRDGGPCAFIIDETQTLKRAKKMAGVTKLYHHATGQYGTGHTILKTCLLYRGVVLPLGSWLWLKPEHARREHLTFWTLTGLAARAIHEAVLPAHLTVRVLFDAYYLCGVVAQACRARGWHYIGVAKSNRNLVIHGVTHRVDAFGRNVLRRGGRWQRIEGLRTSRTYRVAERVGSMKKLGEVKVVFSRRRGEQKVVALVTDDLGAPAKRVVGDYLKRWAIELLIKDQKQHLGLGDYRVLRYRAVDRHLHLVDVAYACLTHLALTAPGAQGHKKKTSMLHLPPISALKARMRQVVWQEGIRDVIHHAHEKPVIRRLERLLAA
jgi:SRSO17 transposase